MNRKITTILLLIALSEGSTLYGIFLILTFHYTITNGTSSTTMGSEMVMQQPFFLVPLSLGIIGWLLIVYEIIGLQREELPGTLRKEMSREGFDREVYRIFSSRGGARRLAIMRALDTPKLRNEIANITNTDWKEVDRNIKILESLNLVRIQFSHGSLSVYHLTESGKELLEIIHSQIKSNGSKASTVHS